MSLTLKESAKAGGDFQIAPAGNHLAICYQIVELGQHHNAQYDKWQPKIQIGWELPNETMDDGRPFVISARYTASFHEKAILRQHLESWRGRPFTDQELAGFDLKNILGKACMVNVVHNSAQNGKTYANVKSVAAVPKGMNVPEQINDSMVFEFGDQGFDEQIFNSLPQWLQTTITSSREYQTMTNDTPVDDVPWDDDIKF
jgi:hypothetical protein